MQDNKDKKTRDTTFGFNKHTGPWKGMGEVIYDPLAAAGGATCLSRLTRHSEAPGL